MIVYTLNNNKRKYMTIINHEKEYDTMSESVKKLIDDTESKMFKLIEDYNEKIEEDDNLLEDENVATVDTVDLSSKFSELSDYLEDFTS